jgi:HEAT repeat protein/beta-lactamase regulating signal transducer with metallopeptidase domain
MTWTTWLADLAIKSSALLLCAFVVNRLLLRDRPAATRHAVWILALASSLAAPALSAFLPRWHVPLLRVATEAASVTPATASIATSELIAATSALVTRDAIRAPRPSPSPRPEPAPTPAVERRLADAESRLTGAGSQPAAARRPEPGARTLLDRLPGWSTLATGLWALVAGLFLLRQTVATLRTARFSRRARTPGRAPWMATARRLARSIGAPGTRFLRSEAISMPIACGLLRPTVVLPAEADQWPDERVRVVLLHELAHVRRRDCLTQAVADAACGIFWFNPLAWMAVRELRRERERACDDEVLAAGTTGPDYAAHLLDIARAMRGASLDSVFSSGVAMAHRSELEGRLMAILDDARPRRALTTRGLALASTFSMVLVAPLAAMNPWVFEDTINAAESAAQPSSAVAGRPSDVSSGRSAGRGVGHGHGEGHGEGAGSSDVATHVETHVATAVSSDVATEVANAVVAGVSGGVSGGIAGGMAGGVANGVAHGVLGGVVADIVAPHIATSVSHGVLAAISSDLHLDLDGQDAAVAGGKDKSDKAGKKERTPADPRMVAALSEALKDSDADVRKAAIQALVQLRDPSTFDAMVVALKDKDDDVRQQAAFSLGQFRDKRAVAALTGVLNDTNAEVRQQAVFALGQLRDISTLDALSAALKDADAEVRQQAAFALSQLRDARALPALIVALQDKDEEVRQQAAFALSQIRDPKAVDGLLIAIKDSNAEVRQQALFALGQIGDARGADAAMAALKDPDPEVRQMAAQALGQLLRGK